MKLDEAWEKYCWQNETQEDEYAAFKFAWYARRHLDIEIADNHVCEDYSCRCDAAILSAIEGEE